MQTAVNRPWHQGLALWTSILGNTRYHGRTKGYYPLSMAIIHNCGYIELNTNDVILSYNDIVHLHGEVMENWEHPWGYYKGPQLDRFTENGLPLFPRLEALNVDTAVAFIMITSKSP
jgi:hypothetical protein